MVEGVEGVAGEEEEEVVSDDHAHCLDAMHHIHV